MIQILSIYLETTIKWFRYSLVSVSLQSHFMPHIQPHWPEGSWCSQYDLMDNSRQFVLSSSWTQDPFAPEPKHSVSHWDNGCGKYRWLVDDLKADQCWEWVWRGRCTAGNSMKWIMGGRKWHIHLLRLWWKTDTSRFPGIITSYYYITVFHHMGQPALNLQIWTLSLLQYII